MSMIVPSEGQTLAGKLWNEIKDFKDRHMKDDRAEGGEGLPDVHPFAHLEKMSVLLEGRAFSDSGFVRLHPKRCCQHLTKLLWFFGQGDPVVGPEAQDVFFGVTKLFQSPDGNLRRLVYLFLRAAAEGGADATNLIIVTQSLVKDMFNETALYRGNALRVLGAIVDPSMLGQLERYFKQMIVDKDGYVASAALTTSLRLLGKPGAADTIGRWASEVHTVLTTRSGSDMTQFHALALLRAIKRHDRLAVSKVVGTLMKGGVRSPLALCLLIRYATSLHAADPAAVPAPALVDFLESCLTHRSEMVLLEAARALVGLPAASASAGGRDTLGSAVRTLHVFLSSPRGALRFAAVRTLHALAGSHPAAVARCADELEGLISDSNRAVATLAITTLLKTGGSDSAAGGAGGGTASASLDRLIKQIGGFLSDSGSGSSGSMGSDELKIAVVSAIHDLALRVPSKHRSLMSFLANALREEGGFEFKRAVLDALLDIVEAVPEAAPEGLLHLCEFIEDCEYTSLASRVLHTLGDRGPSSPQPAQFIRYIHNRVILEAPPVRASAVTALAKFAARVPELRPSIVPLLARCVDDDDDEVRDRAALFLSMLGGSLPAPPAPGAATPSAGASAGAGAAPADGEAASAAASAASAAPAAAELLPFEASLCRSMVGGRLPLPIASLTKALTLYAMRPGTGAFSFDALPHVEVPAAALAAAASPAAGGAGSGAGASAAAAAAPADAAAAGGAFGFASEVRAAEVNAAAAKVARARARAADAAAAAASAGGIGSAGAAAPGAAAAAGGAGGASAGSSAAGAAAGDAAGASSSADALYRIPEFAAFGPLFRSCRPVPLTEAEVEYTVAVTKHVFEKHVVLQFAVANTLPEVLLERAAVAVSVSDAALYAPVVSIAAPKVRSGAPATCYVALARNPDAPLSAVTVSAELRFASRECDPASGEPLSEATPETYPVDGFDISPADYVAPTPVADFRGAWEASGAGGEVIESYQLPARAVDKAVASIAEALGMAFCDGTGTVRPGATRHAAFLSGTFLGGVRVLARMQVQLVGADGTEAAAGGGSGVIVKVGVRSEDRDVSQLLMDCIS